MENKKEKPNENKEEPSRPHFTKVIDYNDQPWLTDIIFGQRTAGSHAHATLSGAAIIYLRTEEGKEIIRNGSIVSDKSSHPS